MKSGRRRLFCCKILAFTPLLAGLLAAAPARAAVYSYVDWSAADVAAGTASGTITLPDNSTVTVTFAAINEDLSPGTLFGAQTQGGDDFWTPSAPYISARVENAPPTTDILQLMGGLNQTYRVTLSEPIKDPIMAIVSLGSAGTACTYDFDVPFTIVSQGVGWWGGSATALQALPGDILEGYEGHGTIGFVGTFSTFSWTVPTPEGWHGFTFGIRTTERIEPTPSEGGAGGGGSEAGAGGLANEGGAGGTLVSEAGAGGSSESEGGAPGPGEGGGGGLSRGGTTNEPTGGSTPNGGTPNDGGRANDGGASDDGVLSATKQDAGCGCSVPGTSLGGGLGALAVLAAATLARARRTRRRSR